MLGGQRDADEDSSFRNGAVEAIILMILAGGCASSSTLVQPAETSQKSVVGTSDESSPLSPAEINQDFRHLPGEDHF